MDAYQYVFSLLDKVTEPAKKIAIAINGIGLVADKTTVGLSKLGQSAFVANQFSQAIQGVNDVIGKLNVGADFEQGMADFQAITGIAGAQLQTLGQYARQVGLDSGLGAANSVEAFKLLASNIDVGSLGKTAAEQNKALQELHKSTIMLSQASGLGLADSTNAMVNILNQYGLSATNAAKVTDVLAAGAKYGAAEVNDLQASLQGSGTTAKTLGVTLTESVGAIEVMSKQGLKGAEAGTALRNVMLKLATEVPGVNLAQDGLAKSLEKLKPKLTDTTYLSKVFGMENVNAATALISNSTAITDMAMKVNENGVAQEQAAIRTDTYTAKMQRIKAMFDDFAISIFNGTKEFLPFVQMAGTTVQTISQIAPAYDAIKLASTGLKGVFVGIGSSIAGASRSMLSFGLSTLTSIGMYVGSLVTATAAQIGLNIAISANPIGIAIAAIAALGIAVYGLVKNWDTVKVYLLKAAQVLWELNPFSWLIKVVDYYFPNFSKSLSSWWGGVQKFLLGIVDWIFDTLIGPVYDYIKDLFGLSGETAEKISSIGANTSNSIVAPAAIEGLNTKGNIQSIGATKLGVQSNLNTIKGESSNNRIQNISISKMIENLNVQITKLDGMGEQQIADAIKRVLLGVVNDVNYSN